MNRRIAEPVVATVVVESSRRYHTRSRLDAMARIVAEAATRIAGRALILFPGGWFKATHGRSAESLRNTVVREGRRMLRRSGNRFIAVFGLDGRRYGGNACEQLGVAISGKGILAIGRKFFASPGETILPAKPWHGGEAGFDRVVEVHGRRLFIAVCFDCFGIRHLGLRRPNVDAVLVLVHGFHPAGEKRSGDVLFARHGLAGCARTWKLPVFASAVFANRLIPSAWPSGIRWRGPDRTTLRWSYSHNGIRPSGTWSVPLPGGHAEIRTFHLGRGGSR